MEVTYRHRADAAFYWTLINRYYRQRPFALCLPVQFGIIGLAVAAYMSATAPDRTVGTLVISLGVGALIFLGGIHLTKLSILYRFKRRADFGSEATVILSDSGIASHGEHVEGKWNWAAYPQAVRFPDGILLLRRGVIRWLPDADIQQGDANSATALVAKKTSMRKVA